MTRTTTARTTGAAFLVYIGAGVAGMAIALPPLGSIVSSLVMTLAALVLGVTLYGLTREQDHEIALLGLTCRVAEGVVGVAFMPIRLALNATAAPATAPDAAALQALTAVLLKARTFNTMLGATFFAIGSLLFCWLLLRGRTIPATLAWIGVGASLLLVAGLPLQLAGMLKGPVAQLMWLPMAGFEIPVGVWLLVTRKFDRETGS